MDDTGGPCRWHVVGVCGGERHDRRDRRRPDRGDRDRIRHSPRVAGPAVTELARGSIADRPWGRTLAALGLRGVTGELVIQGDGGKRYAVVFGQGAVVASSSPLATDAAVRIALTGGLISSTQVTEIVRRQQAERNRDEVDVI